MNMRFNPAAGDRSLALRLAMVSAGSVTVQRNQPYVVKGWLLAGQISMIVGPSNVGKSFLALDIAHHTALGKSWHGRRVNGGEVLYIAAEGGTGLRNRVEAVRKHNPALAERFGIDAQAMPSDDGIVLRVPETDQDPPGAEVLLFDPEEIEEIGDRRAAIAAASAASSRATRSATEVCRKSNIVPCPPAR